jgi:acyl-CoA thioesterase I
MAPFAPRSTPVAPTMQLRWWCGSYNQGVLLRLILPVLWCAIACAACASDKIEPRRSDAAAEAAAPPRPAAPPAPVDNSPRVIFLGDSLTAGLGLDIDSSFPALLQQRLKSAGYHYLVVNAGVSGDTSAGGLRRLEWALGEGDPRILVVALGGNDGLRGLPAAQLESNLAAIIEAGQRRGLDVILAGMEAPPNYGPEYTAAFRQTYSDLAKRYDVPLIPFLLQGVAGDPAFNQADGIHPNARGARVVADLVWRTLEPVVKKDQAAR